MILHSLSQLWKPSRNLGLAVQIANACEVSVWRRVQSRIDRLRGAEAHGYIRARASLIVRRELENAALQISPARRRKVIQMALNRIVGRALAERNRRAAQAIQYRRAA